jgi:cellulose synthase/poly-beta-1,6-N-acetylglucosamine synthase-like glycosyltransferase
MIERVGVIVPSYQEARAHATVEALARQTRQPDVIVWANNDPADPNLDITPGLGEGMDNFHVIHVPEKGAGHARHAATEEVLRRAEVDVVFSTDADCTPPPHWIETGVGYLDEHPEAQVAYATTAVREDDEFYRPDYHRQWPDFWANFRAEIVELTGDEYWLHAPPGANMAFRADLYRGTEEKPPITFPRAAFDIEGGADEDVAFGRQVYERWGSSALHVVEGLINPTSMRRFNQLGGPAGMRAYYLAPRGTRAQLMGGSNDPRG